MLYIILGVLVVLGAVIGLVIFLKARKDEINDYYNAAHSILKENQLDEYLKNPYKSNKDNFRNTVKLMVFLKFKDKTKSKYVFELEKEVYIGRDKNSNEVWGNEPIVSGRHCRLITNGTNVYVQDIGSANGLEIKRGIFTYTLGSGETTEIFSNDTLKIGTTKIRVVIFSFNAALM